jgi:hypothetical protein
MKDVKKMIFYLEILIIKPFSCMINITNVGGIYNGKITITITN